MSSEYTIENRITELIEYTVDPQKKFTEFEEITGIKKQTWANITHGKQRANSDTLEAIGKKWPQYAYWIMTGETDEKNGHTSPILEKIQRDLKRAKKAS